MFWHTVVGSSSEQWLIIPGDKRVRAVGQGGAWGKAANNQGHLSLPKGKRSLPKGKKQGILRQCQDKQQRWKA